MSLETASERKRKRIIEHVLGPFDNAFEAIRFGNTVQSLVNGRLNKIKFRQSIGATDTFLAINQDYIGDTMLKTVFMEVQETEAAKFICDQLRVAVGFHNEENAGRVVVTDEVMRDKPIPQFIGG